MNFFICFCLAAVVVGTYAQCGQRADSLYQCTDRVEQGQDWQLLKNRKMQLAQQCVQRNYTWQSCFNDANKMMSCFDRYVQSKNTDPQMMAAKQQYFNDLDNCARSNPTSPLVVLMKGPDEARKNYNNGGKLSDLSMDGPVVNCLKTFTQGILETFMNPKDIAPVMQQIGLNADIESDQLMGLTATCKPFIDCCMVAEQSVANDQQLLTAARNVYNQKQKCMADFGVPFECVSSSKEQDQCTERVNKAMMKQKADIVKTCMQSQTPIF